MESIWIGIDDGALHDGFEKKIGGRRDSYICTVCNVTCQPHNDRI